MRKQVKTLEDNFQKERKAQGRTVIGEKRLRETDPRARPENPKESGKEPLAHAADKALKSEFKKQWRYFRDQYIAASADYRNGIRDREFPFGSYKPPLLDISKANGP